MMNDKKFLALGTVACLFAFTANGALAQSSTLSVMSFGGAYQAGQKASMFDTYTAAKGVKMIEQEYGGEIAKIKAMVQSGNTTIDVIDVDAPTLIQGCDEGLYEKIDWAKIGNKSEWIPGTATECGVGTIVYATAVAYDAAKLANGPTTIADLFDLKKFPGKRGLWKNPTTNLEFALMADGVEAADVYKVLKTKEGVDRAFKKLDTIKSSIVWWEAGAQAPQLLASGEVVMTTAWNGRIANANKEGKNFKIMWDGEMLDSDYWAIPKGSKNAAAATDFIAFSVQPEHLAALTKFIPYGPVRSTAAPFVAADVAPNLPTSPANMKKALTTDSAFWGDHGDELRKRFTTWLAN